MRCELDMDAGSFQLFINGSPAATFTGLQVYSLTWFACVCSLTAIVSLSLQGQEVFPAVQFYSSGRVVRLLSFEASGLGASAAVPITRLCTLEEVRAAVGYGVLGKAGDLGYAYQGNRKVVVASQAPLHSLSMHPPPNHDGKVT